jgi:hypothetical protein
MCKGYDQYGLYANGNGGSVEQLIQTNSPTCGYVEPTPPSTGGSNGGGGRGGGGREYIPSPIDNYNSSRVDKPLYQDYQK